MRHLRLLGVQLRASIQLTLQYRVDFLVGVVMTLFLTLVSLAPMVAVWHARPAIAGWSFHEALLVIAWFTLLRGVLEGAVQPSLSAVVEHIRQGTLDFVLLKPADAQFLVSTQRFELWRITDVLAAIAMMVWAFHKLGRVPAPGDVAIAITLTLSAVALVYALAIFVISAAFWVVRLDNLIFLFNAVFDAGRWPATVFRGFWKLLFTFVIPLALMTTYPALALLGKLATITALEALFGALAFALLARVTWLRAIGHYTSASS
jgi:ABC-2 type transport system permease protein